MNRLSIRLDLLVMEQGKQCLAEAHFTSVGTTMPIVLLFDND
jgi:hypothetical protein